MFQKRETLTQNIAYMGIMAAINVIFVLMTYFVPFLLFVLVFILPLTSAIVTLYCKKKYFPIYAIATTAICFLVTINNFTDTLFYVIPAIFSGFAFGILIEKKMPVIWIILITTIITVGFGYAFVPLIKFIYGTDIVVSIATLFGLKDYRYLNYVVPCVILFISLAQSTISYIVIKTQLPKLKIETNDEVNHYSTYLGSLVFIGLELLFVFVLPELSYLFMIGVIYFSIFVFIDFASKLHKISLILSAVSLLIGVIVFISVYKYIKEPLSLHLINITFVLVLIIGFVDNCLPLHKHALE